MRRFAERVALVTGGGSGIGAAVARRLAAEGAALVVAGRRPAAGAQVVHSIAAAGGTASFVRADVTVEDEVAAMVGAVLDRHGRLDVCFNNAGSTTPRGPVRDTSSAAWDVEIAVNLTSVFLCLKHEVPAMGTSGAIVNNASIAAVSGTPGMAAYTAAKHGVLGLTRAVALECVDDGPRVNALITGNVDTPLYRELSGVDADAALPAAPNPMRRTATADEVAGYVAYLLSPEAAFVTGAAATIDGGFTAG